MGLFGKLFEKKICSVCGEEIKLLGNRKLEDGNLCKDCAKKLSPWFDDRRHSTVEQIAAQLRYREENLAALASFRPTRTLGRDTVVMIDEGQRRFLVSKTGDPERENSDIIDLDQVTGCDLDIDHEEDEVMRRDSEGNEISYTPPRFRHSFDFNIIIRVRHPYFDEMRFRLNRSSVTVETVGRQGVFGNIGANPMRDVNYQEYERMGREICDTLMNARQETIDTIAADNAPKQKVTCPYCGATTTPDASGCCEFCGGSVAG